MKELSVYAAYFVQFLKLRMAYRWDFLASILSNTLVTISGLLFVVFLLGGKSVNSMQDWSRDEVLFIYGYSMIAMAMFSCIAPNLYRFGDKYVIEGQFDRILLRPLNSAAQVLFESFNLESVGSLMVGVGVILYSADALGITFGLIDLLWIIISSVSGAVILLAVFVIIASCSFHFEDRIGIAPPVYNLIAFGRYPLPVFNDLIQFILKWVIPFAFVAFYPSTHFFERHDFKTFCYLTPVIALLFVSLAGVVWRFGVSRYKSTGH